MSNSCLIYLAFVSLLRVFTYSQWKTEYSECNVPWDRWFLFSHIILLTLLVSSMCSCRDNYFRAFQICFLFLSVVALICSLVVGQVFYVMYTFGKDSKVCLSSYENMFLGFLFCIVLVFQISLTRFVISASLAYLKDKTEKDRIKRLLPETYNKLLKNQRIDIEAFLKKNERLINSIPFSEMEGSFLKNQYKYRQKPNESLKDCTICLDGAEQDAVEFPQCNHVFHYDCLEVWLKKKGQCPICKGEFRVQMLRSLLLRNQEYKKIKDSQNEDEEQRGNETDCSQ